MWEYKLLNLANQDEVINPLNTIIFSETEFNKLGKQGWEMVTLSSRVVAFKRKIGKYPHKFPAHLK